MSGHLVERETKVQPGRMENAVCASAPLYLCAFYRRKRRALRWSLTLSMLLHSAVSLLLFHAMYNQLSAILQASKRSTPSLLSEDPVTMVDVVEKEDAVGMSPAMARARIRVGARDASRQDSARLLHQLASLLLPASKISDPSLDEIASYLGRKKGAHRVRTHYRNEHNRNANFMESRVVQTVVDPTGLWVITLEDKEKDRFIFTLKGAEADALGGYRHFFGGTPLPNAPAGQTPFEWKGAAIADIKRWKRKGDKTGLKGVLVHWHDPEGAELVLKLAGKKWTPFFRERMRFAMNRMGRTDDGSTLWSGGFDFNSAFLLKVDRIRHNGKPKVRQVLVDKNGERLISVTEGKMAEEVYQSTRILENPVLNNIYQRIGPAVMPEMVRDAEKKHKEKNEDQ